MKKLFLVLGVCAFSSMSVAQSGQESVRLELDMKVSQVHRLTTSGTYKGDVANMTLNLEISGISSSGEKLDYKMADVPGVSYSPSEIRIISNSSIEMKDLKKGSTQVLRATVDEDSVVVSSEHVGQSLAAELKKRGQDLVNTLSLSTSDASLNYNLNISDMKCARSARELTCDLSANLVLDISSK